MLIFADWHSFSYGATIDYLNILIMTDMAQKTIIQDQVCGGIPNQKLMTGAFDRKYPCSALTSNI